ncbi:MAG: hypothetical protein ACI87F_000808, partial [Candidatus Azotimanducaceae bacterium]
NLLKNNNIHQITMEDPNFIIKIAHIKKNVLQHSI